MWAFSAGVAAFSLRDVRPSLCSRARRSCRLNSVKKNRRKFQSEPIDFGVVGLDDEDLLTDEDLNDLEDVDDLEDYEDVEDFGSKDALVTPNRLRPVNDLSRRENQEGFVTSELLPDNDLEDYSLPEFDPAEFDTDDDLIDISDENLTDDMLIVEEQEEESDDEVDLSFMKQNAPFQSQALEQFVEEKMLGYVPPISTSVVDDYNRIWAAGISPEKRFKHVKNQYSRVGVNIGYNFSDFVENPDVDLSEARIEEESAYKAKAVYEATGLPAISVSTCWDIETGGMALGSSSHFHRTLVDDEVDTLIEKLRPRSDKNRKVFFRSIAAFYDGETELLTEGSCEVAMFFAQSSHATIAIGSAFDNLFMELWKKYNFQFVEQDNYLGKDSEELGEMQKKNKRIGGMLLKERILREGKVLNGGILKVSSFLNHMVDADLMDICGEDLAERLRYTMPNKVLTVEATGLIPALSVARRLSIPVVFARKSRPITISESFQTMYQSKTKGQLNELIVSREYLKDGDRVLLIDDFLAGGYARVSP